VLCDECREHFDALRAYLDLAGIPYTVNPQIVRGLDYYNRTVFEIVSGVLGAQSTVCGGGRYDGLVASLGGPPTPGVGFALGMERFLIMAQAAGTAVEAPRRGYQAIALGPQARARLVEIVGALRGTYGRPAFMEYEERKLKAHFKIADRNRARYALILGSEELEAGVLVMRDLESRTQRQLELGRDVAAAIVEAGE
jgi:histidyl-tRNA synthetase